LAAKYKRKEDKVNLIFGNTSLGHFLCNENILCIPSDKLNFNNCEEFANGNAHYFEGGHTTKNYGNHYDFECDAIQIEMSNDVRNVKNNFKNNGINVANAIFSFFQLHYHI